jgi:hypothetical protein
MGKKYILFVAALLAASVLCGGAVAQNVKAGVAPQAISPSGDDSVKAFVFNLQSTDHLTKTKNVGFSEEGAKSGDVLAKGVIESAAVTLPPGINAVSINLRGENLNAGAVKIFVRRLVRKGTWSAWEMLPADEDLTYEPQHLFSRLAGVGVGDKFIQCRVEILPDMMSPPRIQELALITFAESSPAKVKPAEVHAEQALSLASLPKPPIVSREAWGCPDGEASPKATPESAAPITHFIIHHSLTGTQSNNYAQWVKNIWRIHYYGWPIGRGWGDIAYNYLIAPDGTIYEGRAGGDSAKGFHFSCQNSNTSGIALLGDFTSTGPEPSAVLSLEKLLAWRTAELNIDPLGSTYHPGTTLTLKNISGHRDGNSSPKICEGDGEIRTCPGNAFYNQLDAIRQGVANMRRPKFSVSVTPNIQLVTQGGTASFQITLQSINNFSGTVAVAALNLPPGYATGTTMSPASIRLSSNGSATAMLTVRTSTATQVGSFTTTIKASGGSLEQSANVVIGISPATGTVKVNAMLNGQPWPVSASGAVSFSVVGPQGTIIGMGVPSSTGGAAAGQYRIIYNSGGPGQFLGVSQPTTQTLTPGGAITFTLNFNKPAGDFAITVLSANQTVTRGGTATYTIRLQSNNGFSGSVGLYAINLPANQVLPGTGFSLQTVFVPASGSATTTLRIVTNNATPRASFNVTVRGVSGSLVRETNLALGVR